MTRAASIALATIFALILVSGPASAGRLWCRADPIVRLDGVEYQVFISIPDENVPEVNGPLVFDVYSPRDTAHELIFVDAGFNGHGETVEFREHDKAFVHTFFAKVSRTGSDFPALIEVFQDGVLIASAEGTSNGVSVSVEIVDGARDSQAHTSLMLGDAEYDIVVTADEQHLNQVNGELFVEVTSQKGADQQRLSVEPGFNGYGTDVKFRQEDNVDGHTIYMQLARNGSDFPLNVAVYRNGVLVTTATGLTNGLSFTIPA